VCKSVLFYFWSLIDEKGYERIHQAINEFKQYTCIEIKDRTNEDNYVKISSDYSGC